MTATATNPGIASHASVTTICRVHTVDFGIIATLQERWSKRGGNSVEPLFPWERSLVPSQYLDAPS